MRQFLAKTEPVQLVADKLPRADAFGGYRTQPHHTVNPGITDHGYTGHRMNNTGDDNLGLIYMNARYYMPEIGRFISPDTIVPDAGNPQSYNRYSYVLNSPMNNSDPTGHKECVDFNGATCIVTLPHATNQQIALAAAWIYYEDNFNLPFDSDQPVTQEYRQGSGGHNGADFGGQFHVVAPADGEINFAGSTPGAGAGIWRIRNRVTGEIREWSQFCHGGPPTCNPPLRGSTGVLEPIELLASGDWEDIKPGWSHEQGTKIEIIHGNNLRTIYFHVNVQVEDGLTVTQGDELGITANIGWSTNIHLHYTLVWTYDPSYPVFLDPLNPPANIAHLLQ